MKFLTKAMVTATMMLLVALSPLLGQQQNRNVTFLVTLNEWYDIYISPTTITFTDVPPQIVDNPPTAVIEANQKPVDVRAFAIIKPNSTLRLTVTANSDFHATIPASTVSWTASGPGYRGGTLQNRVAVTVGEWSGSILHWRVGQLYFVFSRDYLNQEPGGTYLITAIFTLSKP